MKKINTILILLICLGASLFAGCSNDAKVKGELLTSFETYDEIIDFTWLNTFGTAKQTQDKEFVTEGDSALYLEVSGNYKTNRKPAIGIRLGTDFTQKKDFSDVAKISVDVFNDNDFETNIYLQYLTNGKDINLLSNELPVVLAPKKMTTAEFVINRDFMAQLLKIEDLVQVRLAFDNSTKYDEPYRKFYIDNMRYYLTSEPINKNYKIRKEGELESADRPDYLSVWANINQYQYTPSSLEFNNNSAYIKSGAGSFKMSNITGYHTTPTYGAGWKTVPYISDISTYANLSYWLYNEGNEDVRVLMYNGDDTAFVYVGTAIANGWTKIVVSTETLETNKYNLKNYKSFQIVVEFPSQTPCSIYFDEIMLNK